MNTGKIIFVLLLCANFPDSPACAYFDPNVGGSIFQMLMPIAAVLLGFVVFAWNFIKKKAVQLFVILRKVVVFVLSRVRKKEKN